jgi:sporulation protein YlmC with PRC-barrel domain
MKSLKWMVAAVAVVCVAGVPAVAGHRPAAVMKPASEVKNLTDVKPVERATEFIGKAVRNVEANLNGTVKDIVLTEDRKHVDYFAIAFGGFDRLYAVNLKDLRITADGSQLVYAVTPKQLEGLAGFPSTAWPEGLEVRRVSHLLGLSVRDTAGTRVGEIRDLLIATADGRVTEATVTVAGFFSIRDKLASVEWSSVMLPQIAKFAQVNLTAREIRALAYSENDYWQRLGFRGGGAEEHNVNRNMWPDEPWRVLPRDQTY